ncbi:MAG: hypothetical protein [Inoviridae sp.]|nr:MAG: hypothetical protein [Inoviridae sp.]
MCMLDWFAELLAKFGNMILSVLPKSPIQQFLGSFSELPYLSALNWFFPVSSVIIVMEAWLVAIACFYLYSLVLRWIKAIS